MAGVMVIGLALRLWGIDFGLPCTYCRPDESTLVHKALSIASGDLNPHFFNYPSLYFYLLAVAYGGYYGVGWLAGWFAVPADFARAFFLDPSPHYLIARTISVAAGSVTVLVVWGLGRRIGGRAAGLFSAGFLAVAYLHVRDSHFATVDVLATLLAVSSLYVALRYLKSGALGTLAICGFLLGVASSTKYSALLLAPGVGAAILMTTNSWRGRANYLGACALAAVAGFLLGTPYALLDAPRFLQDLAFEGRHYVSGHAAGAITRGGFSYYLWFVLRYGMGAPLLATSLFGAFIALWRRRPSEIVVLSGVVGYFVVLSASHTGFVRYVIPLIPLLCVLAGSASASLWRRHREVAAVIALLVALPSAKRAVACDDLLSRTDTRVLAGQWLEQTVEDGASVAMFGSDYGFPHVRRSRSWLRDALAHARATGARGARMAAMLASPEYPRPPSYYVVQINPAAQAQSRFEWRDGSSGQLRSAGIEWLVIHDYPLPYSEAVREDLSTGEDAFTLQFSVDPRAEHASAAVYDCFDAFFLPFAGLEAVTRPGPHIRIYRAVRPGRP